MSFSNPGGNPSVYANYFIDDISVLKPCAVTPSITVSASSPSVCQGTSLTLTASGSSNYTWSPSNSLSSSGGAVVSANPSGTTIYTISAFDGSCSSFTTTTVTVVPYPTLAVTSSTPSFCSPGGTVFLTAGGASSYTWTSLSALSSSTGVNVSANVSATSTFSLNGSNNTCFATIVITIPVLPQPTLLISGPTQLICRGQSAALAAFGADAYNWSTGQTGTLIIVNPPSTAAYTVTGTNAYGCSKTSVYTVSVAICEGISSQNQEAGIRIYPNPAKDFIFIEGLDSWNDLIVMDGTGKVVEKISKEALQNSLGGLKLDLNNLDKGIYFLKGNYQSQTLTYKFVKD